MAGGYGRRKGNGAGQGSTGDGWGGPAKGASTKVPRVFDSQTSAAANAARWGRDPATMSKAEIRAARTADLETKLFTLALEAEREETQVSASRALHAIYNGTPMASVQHSGPDGQALKIESIRRVIIDPTTA